MNKYSAPRPDRSGCAPTLAREIAEKSHQPSLVLGLDAASQHPNIHVIPRRLTDQEYVDCVSACDVILLPHLTVTTSGALLGALSCSRPVVASRHPYFEEILTGEPQAGQLCEIGSPTGLLQSLRLLLEEPAEARAGAAERIATKYDWKAVIEPVVAAIGQIAVNRYPEIEEGLPTT